MIEIQQDIKRNYSKFKASLKSIKAIKDKEYANSLDSKDSSERIKQ